jgi:predicted patatin/cPLA2 family phospholipase
MRSPGVLDVIKARRAAGSRPGRRDDAHRVALVVEGGGMRGVVSAGMTVALEQLGLRDSFDVVYGTSAGAFAGAALVVGQAALGCAVFYDALVDRRFIDVRRAARGRGPLIDLDYVIDDVLERGHFDWPALLGSDVPFRPVATALDDLRPHAFGDLATKEEMKVALRASSAIPVLAGPPVPFRGRRWVDGGIVEAIAFRAALTAGATHVLVLQTRAHGDVRAAPPSLARPYVRRRLRALAPGLAEAALASAERYAADVSLLREPGHPELNGAQVLALQPDRSLGVGRLTQDRGRLFAAAVAAAGVVYRAVAGRTPQFVQTFTPVRHA